MRNLPLLLREAERRVNAHVWPNRADTAGHDAHLASIPANRDTDTDLLLIEAADRISALEAALREAMEWNWIEDTSLDGGIPESVVKQCNDALGASELETSAQRAGVPTTNHANLNEACQEILRVLATEKEQK